MILIIKYRNAELATTIRSVGMNLENWETAELRKAIPAYVAIEVVAALETGGLWRITKPRATKPG